MPIIDWLRIPIILISYLRTRLLQRFLHTRRRLEWFQNYQMRKHLNFLSRHSPYFRHRLDIEAKEDWRSLSTMTKSEMMKNFDRINTRQIAKSLAFDIAIHAERTRDFNPTVGGVTVGLSSGTSGHRGLFLASRIEQWRYAGTVLAKILPGFWRRQNRIAFFLRANSNLYTAVRSRLLQFEYFDLFQPVAGQVDRLNTLQPTLLIAPPSLLRQLAEMQMAGRLSIEPKKIISVAEVLDPIDEKFLMKTFSQKIHQIYQATEGFIAVSCSKGVLHLNEDVMIVEKQWVEETKRKFFPVITDFSRRTQPIIRYRLNDILVERESPCDCGSPFTALDCIEGRSDDVFHFPATGRSGSVCVYPDFIRRALLLASEQVTDYRITQTGASQIEVRVCAAIEEKKITDSIRREFAQLAHQLEFQLSDVDVRVNEDFVPRDNGAKLRRVINAWAPSSQ